MTTAAATATAAARSPWIARTLALRLWRPPAATLLVTLIAISAIVRTQELGVSFWIDEAISVGIASRPLSEIPGVLQLDGSPPLYYLLLHGWMEIAGRSEAATHLLSVIFALLAVPAAFWAGRSLFGARAGWIGASVAAGLPFLTAYAQETRMYALVVTLAIVCAATFVHAFVFRRRHYLPLFAVALAALFYTHNWAFFFGASSVVALLWLLRNSDDRRRLGIDALLAYGFVVLAYLPWLTTFIYQSQHTGAPWARRPPVWAFGTALMTLFGGPLQTLVVAAAVVLTLALLLGPRSRVRPALAVLLIMTLGTLLLPWLVSQINPSWAQRYVAIAVGPALLLAAASLSAIRGVGILAAIAIVSLGLATPAPERKSNVSYLARSLSSQLKPGDLVISTQPEQVPVLSYYLNHKRDLLFATPLGRVGHPEVVDWRDGVARFDSTSPQKALEPLLRDLPVGAHVLLVRPFFIAEARWKAPWTSRVRARSYEWLAALDRMPNFRAGESLPPPTLRPGPQALRGIVYTKTAVR